MRSLIIFLLLLPLTAQSQNFETPEKNWKIAEYLFEMSRTFEMSFSISSSLSGIEAFHVEAGTYNKKEAIALVEENFKTQWNGDHLIVKHRNATKTPSQLVEIWVVDATTLIPLDIVEMRVLPAGLSLYTNRDGRVDFTVPGSAVDVSLSFQRPFYREKKLKLNLTEDIRNVILLFPEQGNMESMNRVLPQALDAGEFGERRKSAIALVEDDLDERITELFDWSDSDKPHRKTLVYGSFIPGVQWPGSKSAVEVDGFGLGLLTTQSAYVNGLTIAGLANFNRFNTNGMQLGGAASISGGKNYGLQMAGVINYTGNSFNGMQVSGAFNHCSLDLTGLQLSGAYNRTALNVTGMQLSGAINLCGGELKGMQLSGLMNTADENRGFQLAPINRTRRSSGIQLGVVNITKEGEKGLQFGLLNIHASGVMRLRTGYDELGILDLQFISGNPRFFSFIGAGYSVGKVDGHWEVEYGLGTTLKSWIKSDLQLTTGLRVYNQGSWSENWNLGIRPLLTFNTRVFGPLGASLSAGYQYYISHENLESIRVWNNEVDFNNTSTGSSKAGWFSASGGIFIDLN